MYTNTLSDENAHLIINAVVLLFLVVGITYNWKLIKEFGLKISEAYREHRVHNHKI
ncbi:MAG TPA: hypothetical protein VF679_03355 [Pedobacter sp.]